MFIHLFITATHVSYLLQSLQIPTQFSTLILFIYTFLFTIVYSFHLSFLQHHLNFWNFLALPSFSVSSALSSSLDGDTSATTCTVYKKQDQCVCWCNKISSGVMHIVLVHRTGNRQITIVADPKEIAENPGIIPIGFNCYNMCCEPMRHWAVPLVPSCTQVETVTRCLLLCASRITH